MKKLDLTARQMIEYKGARTYLFVYSLMVIASLTSQLVARVPFGEIASAIGFFTPGVTLAVIILLRKRRGKTAGSFAWILGFLSVSAPIITKFKYGIQNGWTFAGQSYNTSALLVLYVVMLYLFYKPRLFKTIAAVSFVSWGIFLYVSYINGADWHFISIVNGVPVVTGVHLVRELNYILAMLLVSIIAYRNIPVINEYDEATKLQKNMLESAADEQRENAVAVKESMSKLLAQVNMLDGLSRTFSDRVQSQAASFEEMSASLEELSASSERIAEGANQQVEGNTKMESIVNEFQAIQSETKHNLDDTLTDITAVSESTGSANEQLKAVESTVAGITEQSTRIKDTVSIIVDIADKINLLSLNASIEAARAGDAGRGFAVVADEIGKLAAQTQDSIKDIESVLSLSAKNTAEGVVVIQSTAQMVRDMVHHMSQGSNKIKILQESILIEERFVKVIIGQMYKNIDLAHTIGTGTDEQKNAIQNSVRAIDNMNEMLSAMVKEIQELADSLHMIHQDAAALMKKAEQEA